MVINILEVLNLTKEMDLVLILNQMDPDTKETGKMIKSMAREWKY